MKRICVYCGSGLGNRAEYAEAAASLGKALVEDGVGLVFGGGRIGMMGAAARAVLDGGGEAIGVIPQSLMDRDLALLDVTDLRIVPDMHQRKAMMAELADAFIALPGGFGTVEELFEILTWAQLGFHAKPVGLLNVSGYFDHLIRFVEHAVTEGFIAPGYLALLLVNERPADLLAMLEGYETPEVDKAQWALDAKDVSQ